jgi:multidrug resistance protein, MATE family
LIDRSNLPDIVDDRTLRGQVLQIAWPVIVENLLQSLLSVVIFWMVSRLGVDAIAGVGNAQQYQFVGFAAFGALAMGSSVLVSHSVGARDPLAAGRVAKQSLGMAIALGLGLALVFWFGAYDLNLMLGVTHEVALIGAQFLRVFALGTPLLVLVFICAAIIRGTGDSRTPMQINLGANSLGAVLSYGFIFGVGDWPGLGVAGAAWGSVVAWAVASALMLSILLFRKRELAILSPGGWRPNLGLLKRILSIGVPSGVEQFLISGGFLLLTGIIAQMGTPVLAAHRVVFQALSFSNMVGIGLGAAATTLTGIYMGAKRFDLAQRATWVATRWGAIWMSFMAVLLFAFGEPLMLLFAPTQPDVVHYGSQAIRMMAFTQPFFGISNGLSGGLRGAGDTRFPMYMALLGMWLVRLPGAYLFGITFEMMLDGVYLASVLDAMLRSVVFFRRYQAGGWRKLDVLRGTKTA